MDGLATVRVTSVYGDNMMYGNTLAWGEGIKQCQSTDDPGTVRVTLMYRDTLT